MAYRTNKAIVIAMMLAACWTGPAAPGTASVPVTDSAISSHSMTGLWFDQEQEGQGFVVEALPGGVITLTWYTFDSDGRPQWLYALGEGRVGEAGVEATFSQVLRTTGTRFGAEFDPAELVTEVVGSARMRFDGCDVAHFTFDDGADEDLQLDLSRLSAAAGLACDHPHGAPGEYLGPEIGFTGSWFDPERSGEGIQLQWTPSNEVLLTWYTFDTQGRQLWIVGQGQFEAGVARFADLFTASGPRFGAAFDPDDLALEPWGSAEIQLNCTGASFSYDPTAMGFHAGELALQPLTVPQWTGCPWRPRKLTDIYELKVSLLPPSVWARSISDDGKITGTGAGSTVQMTAVEGEEWEPVGSQEVANGLHVALAADGMSIVASEPIVADLEATSGVLEWRAEEGWRLLPGMRFHSSFLNGSSRSNEVLVGYGRVLGDSALDPWIWTRGLGQVPLPKGEGGSETPFCVSDGGELATGMIARFDQAAGLMTQSALVWRDQRAPEEPEDAQGAALGPIYTCSDDGSTAFGSGQARFDPEHPSSGQAWLKRWNQPVRYLGGIEGRDPLTALYQPATSDREGTIAAGRVVGGALPVQGFIWTAYTGTVSIAQELANAGIELNWNAMAVPSMDSAGSRILLVGSVDQASPEPSPAPPLQVGAVLRLQVRQVHR